MSNTTLTTPTKKKRNFLWWIGGAFVALVLLFVVHLFGPSPRIIVSPQTTFITTPLGSDGLPDYERYLLECGRAGVTPQNNAAALLWSAIWPGQLDPPQYATIAAELGLDAIPSQARAIRPVDKFIENWLKSQQLALSDAGVAEFNEETEFDRIYFHATSRPWTSHDFPWLAAWVNDNQKPLDLAVKASRRPRCYFPSPTLLDNQIDPVVSILLAGIHGVRECGESLVARAMWHVGERHPVEAWQDLLAVHRIGRLVAQAPMLAVQRAGIAIDTIANRGTIALLHDGQLTAEQARQILRDVTSLPSFSNYANSIDQSERLFFIDTITQLSRGTCDPQVIAMGTGEVRTYEVLQRTRIDWNFALRRGNEFYDRYAAAARLPHYESRWQAVQQVKQSLRNTLQRIGVHDLSSSTLNLTYRSDVVAHYLLSVLTHDADADLVQQDSANAMHDLTRLAAALAVYRVEKGGYPEKLDDLLPTVLDRLPVDNYQAKPFFYRRIDAGYLLYTAGPNGQDDGGCNNLLNICMGYQLEDLSKTEADAAVKKISAGADDLSIRVPRPPLKPRPTAVNPNQTGER